MSEMLGPFQNIAKMDSNLNLACAILSVKQIILALVQYVGKSVLKVTRILALCAQSTRTRITRVLGTIYVEKPSPKDAGVAALENIITLAARVTDPAKK